MNSILARGLGQKTQPKQRDKAAWESIKRGAQRQVPVAETPETAQNQKSPDMIEPGATMRVLRIVSEESGVDLNDLTDDCSFADLGVDSLLSLIISSRVKEEIFVDTDCWEFSDHPTVKHLKESLGSEAQVGIDEEEETEEEVIPAESFQSSPTLSGPDSITTDPTNPAKVGNGDAEFGRLLQIISEESEVSVDDLTDDTFFVDIGIDDLLSLNIADRCKEELGLDVDTSSMFMDTSTVKDLKTSFSTLFGEVSVSNAADQFVLPTETASHRNTPSEGTFQDHTESESSQTTSPRNSNTSSSSRGQDQADPLRSTGTVTLDVLEDRVLKPALLETRPASSVLLQGRPAAAKKILFLFADGAGSASSYRNLPKVSNDLAIIGINSPYARFPEEMTCTLDQLVDKYITELRRRQPAGPYHLGGWSAGGILAYRATQQIIRDGGEVEDLVLIDSPIPRGLEKLPERFMAHCQSIGLWEGTLQDGRGAAPRTLISHFNATMNILQHFYAEPLPVGLTPKCWVLYATESIMTGNKALPPGDDDVEGMKFLTEKRTDYSPGGWVDLLPGGEIHVEKVEGAHHFSMMTGALGRKTANFIDRAMQ